MKKKYKALSLLTVVTILVSIITICAISAKAAEQQQGNTNLGYKPQGDPTVTFQLDVSIVGNGSVFDGSQEITDSMSCPFQINENKTFRIQPQPGYALKSILYDDTDITNTADEDGYIRIKGRTYDTSLVVTFEEKSPSADSSAAENPGGAPGDIPGGTTPDETPQEQNHTTVGGTGTTNNNLKNNEVKTGDTAGVIIVAVIVLFISSTAILVFIFCKKRNKIKGNKS